MTDEQKEAILAEFRKNPYEGMVMFTAFWATETLGVPGPEAVQLLSDEYDAIVKRIDQENVVDLRAFAQRVHETSVAHGFHAEEGPTARGKWWIPLALLLINEEVGEATKEWRRNGESDAFVEELGDILIRLLDLACRPEVGLDRFIMTTLNKADTNDARPPMHGGKRM